MCICFSCLCCVQWCYLGLHKVAARSSKGVMFKPWLRRSQPGTWDNIVRVWKFWRVRSAWNSPLIPFVDFSLPLLVWGRFYIDVDWRGLFLESRSKWVYTSVPKTLLSENEENKECIHLRIHPRPQWYRPLLCISFVESAICDALGTKNTRYLKQAVPSNDTFLESATVKLWQIWKKGLSQNRNLYTTPLSTPLWYFPRIS